MKNSTIRLSVTLVWAALLVLLWHSRQGRLQDSPAGPKEVGDLAPNIRKPTVPPCSTIGREVLAAVTDAHSGEDHSLAMSDLVARAKATAQLSPADIQSLLAFISAPKPGDLTDGEWEERVNGILNLLRRQTEDFETEDRRQDGAFSVAASLAIDGHRPTLQAESSVPGLAGGLLEMAEKNPSKVLRLYAMQHVSLWFAKESDPAKKRAMVELLEKLASTPEGETAGCAVLMLSDMRRKETEDLETEDRRQDGASSLAGSGARVVTNAPTGAGAAVDWEAVDRLLARESLRLIGDGKAGQDVRISAIHACVDRHDAAPLPELRNIAADPALVSTLRKAAIHAIGQLGAAEDAALLESLPQADGNLSMAIQPARKALAKRNAADPPTNRR